MKKLLLVMLLVKSIFAYTEEDYDLVISKVNDPLQKQIIRCEKEVKFHKDYRSPEVCIKAAEMYSKEKTLSAEQKESFGEAYYNAGIMYGSEKGNKDYKKAAEMYQKSIDVGFCEVNQCSVKQNLAVLYYYGTGVEKNHIKAYNLFKSALDHGCPNAQKGLQILCTESPWACK